MPEEDVIEENAKPDEEGEQEVTEVAKPEESKEVSEIPEEKKEKAPEIEPQAQKVKKINRLSSEELDRIVKELEEARQTKSVYYKHLMMRKRELESSQ